MTRISKKHLTVWAALALCTSLTPPASAEDSGMQDTAMNRDLTPFQQMLVYIYKHDPKLRAERDSLKADDEHVSQAVAGYRPSVTAGGEYGRQRAATGSGDWLYGPDRTESLNAVQPLFNGFGTLAQRRAADARVQAGRAHLLATEQRVFLDAITAWLNLCETSRALSLSLDNFSRLDQQKRAAEQRFHAGDATRTDIIQAEGRLAETESRYETAEAGWEMAVASYERATGLRPPTPVFPPLPARLPETIDAAEQAARSNPVLAEAREEAIAAGHDIDSASSTLWPTVSLRGSMTQQRSPDLGLERLRDDSITVNVSIPLYQGGGEYSRVREAKILHERAREGEMDTLREVVESAREAWHNYHAANVIARANGKATNAAEHALSGVQQEQAQGTRNFLDVLNAESELYNVQIGYVQAEKNARLEAYRLLAAVGSLTASGLSLPIIPYDPLTHYDDTATRAAGF